MSETLFQRACARAAEGMEIAAIAAAVPERIAIYSPFGDVSFGELNAGSNRLARALRARGLKAGDGLALVCGNRPEFAIARFAAHRMGLRLTPVNWHLTGADMAYIIDDCDAKAVVGDLCAGADNLVRAVAGNDRLAVRFAIGEDAAGFEDFHQAIGEHSGEDIGQPSLGSQMLYTSGTTGRPRGVLRGQPDPQKAADMQALLSAVFQFEPDSGRDIALTCGPLYHAGPFNLCLTTPLTSGIPCVFMQKWDAEQALGLIARYGITHTFCVPTMFERLLRLPATTRDKYDISSLRFVIHGAAPIAVETKRRMLDWFGPILWEMFAGTEGPGTIVSPQEWLAKPGTVGKPGPDQCRIYDDCGKQLGPGEPGRIFLRNPADSRFSYYKDTAKTAAAHSGDYFTAGDIGYLDEDGYLFLTGRSAEVIISAGVNIYPQEIDDVLVRHEAVADAACVGVPNADRGEEVKAVVELLPGHRASESLAREILDYCRAHLAGHKIPRSVDFIEVLPRSPAGKVQRSALRARYWPDPETQL